MQKMTVLKRGKLFLMCVGVICAGVVEGHAVRLPHHVLGHHLRLKCGKRIANVCKQFSERKKAFRTNIDPYRMRVTKNRSKMKRKMKDFSGYSGVWRIGDKDR